MNSHKPIIIFLCTPRCGTQWFFKNLSEIYANKAVVTWEPILYEYYLRKNLGKIGTDLKPSENIVLEKHLSYIEETSKKSIYIEIGWQSIAGISKLYDRFSDRLRIVHLYRNPIKVGASLVTHRWYSDNNPVVDRAELAELKPFDDGAQLKEYSKIWDSLNMYEKSLYYWTEVNFCSLAIKNRYTSLPFYSLKFENIFQKEKEAARLYLNELIAFFGLKYDEELIRRLDIRFDNYRNKTNERINWKSIYEFPQTVALAIRLGYDLNKEFDVSRYKVSASSKVKTVAKKIKKRIA